MDEQKVYYVKGSPRFNKFLEGVAAATMHLSCAYESRSALECIVLSAVLIDAQLRIGIIMKKQLESGTDDIDESLLHQKDDDIFLSERKIIKMASNLNLINSLGHDNLSNLYDKRNKCIHRYVISDINYGFVTKLVFQYADALDRIRDAVRDVESIQYECGVGMVKAIGDGKEPDFDVQINKWIEELAEEKDSRPNDDG